MQERDSNLSAIVFSQEVQEGMERYRDVVKSAQGMEFVLLGIENQEKIHYAMPLRCRIYDDLQYFKQVQMIAEKNRKEKFWRGRSGDEFLSGMKKQDRIKACFTIVIYYGEEEWDGPRSLQDMVELPEALRPYFQDYKMQLLCVRDEDGSSFSQRDVKQLFYVLYSLYNNEEEKFRKEKIYVNGETYRTIAAVQKNEKLMEGVSIDEEEGISMCSALDRIWENGRKEGIKEGIKEGKDESRKECIEKLLNTFTRNQIVQALEVSPELVNEIADKRKQQINV